MVSLLFLYLAIGFMLTVFVFFQAWKKDRMWWSDDWFVFVVVISITLILWPGVLYSFLEEL